MLKRKKGLLNKIGKMLIVQFIRIKIKSGIWIRIKIKSGIWIHINIKSGIWIRTKIKSGIWIRINSSHWFQGDHQLGVKLVKDAQHTVQGVLQTETVHIHCILYRSRI